MNAWLWVGIGVAVFGLLLLFKGFRKVVVAVLDYLVEMVDEID